MKKLLNSNSRFYTTKQGKAYRSSRPGREAHGKNYYPGVGHANYFIDDVDAEVIDTVTDDLNQVLLDLKMYRGSVVEPIANHIIDAFVYLRGQLTAWEQDEPVAGSFDDLFRPITFRGVDGLAAFNAYVDVASNLDILEAAIDKFIEITGCEVEVGNPQDEYMKSRPDGCTVFGIYDGEAKVLMSRQQVFTILPKSPSYTSLVYNILLPAHKKNMKSVR